MSRSTRMPCMVMVDESFKVQRMSRSTRMPCMVMVDESFKVQRMSRSTRMPCMVMVDESEFFESSRSLNLTGYCFDASPGDVCFILLIGNGDFMTLEYLANRLCTVD